MRRHNRFISTTLILAMLATTLPAEVFAEGVNTNSTSIDTSPVVAKNLKHVGKIVGELVDKREKNMKIFLKDDGSYEADIYQFPVHYQDNGKWKDIDNTLVSQKDNANNEILQNKDNNFKVQISKSGQANKLVTIQEGNYSISWGINKKDKESKSVDESSSNSTNNVSQSAMSNSQVRQESNGATQNTPTDTSIPDTSKQITQSTLEDQTINSTNSNGYFSTQDNGDINDVEAAVEAKDLTKLKNLSAYDQKRTLTNISSTVDFTKIYKDVDLQYNLNSQDLKENIIINNKIDNPVFKFNLNTANLIPKLQNDKSIIFYDAKDSKKVIFQMNAPYMFDAAKVNSNDVSISLSGDSNKGYILTVTPDNNWLNGPSRVFPITIDPTVTTSQNINSIHDTFVASSDSSNKWLNQYLRVGQTPGEGSTRTFMKFDLPTLQTGDMVTSAQLSLDYSSANSSGGGQVNVHQVTQDFDPTNLYWSNQPSYNSSIEDYAIINSSSSDYYVNWDITSIAKNWYTTGNNYGLMLEQDAGGTAYNAFYSSDWGNQYSSIRPSVSISYINNSGLEDYWTYHSQPIGRGGTGYINDYNGNLIYVHDDLSMTGNKMPISITHVFNSNDKGTDIGYGSGWRLNLSQRLKWVTIGGIGYYEYTNATGTKLYFNDETGPWKDETNQGLTLTFNSDGTYTITDKKNNKLNFLTSGYLSSIIDSNGNKETLQYTGSTLTSVMDGAGRTVNLNVSSNGKLSGVTDPSGRTTSFGYNGAQLTTITYSDNNKTNFTYASSNNMLTAQNYDGYTISYSYYGVAPYRIMKAVESNGSTVGGSLSINYDFNETFFTDAKGRKDTYEFNNNGNTICIKNNDGSASYYKYDDVSNVNKLTTSSKLQAVTSNYLRNHNAQYDSDWTFNNDNYSSGSGSFVTSPTYGGLQRSLSVTKTNTSTRSEYQQTLTLQKGKTYTFSGYIKTSGVSNVNGQGANLLVHYKNNAGTWLETHSSYVSGTNDWARYELTFTIPSDASSGDVIIRTALTGETGTAYFDYLQLEDGNIANRYNLVENADFNFDTGVPVFWNVNSACDSNDTQVSIDGRNTFRFNGVATLSKNLYQTIQVSGNTNDIFALSGWAKGQSVPSGSGRYFALDVGFVSSSDGSINQWEVLPFNQDSSDWQYASTRLIAKYPYKSVIIYALYYDNANKAYFDSLQLYKEEFGQSYQYDANGNVVSTTSLAQQKSQFAYDTNNNLITSTDPSGSKFNYQYDNNHNITSATTAENVVYSFTYDSSGNPLTSKVGDNSTFIQSSANYTTSGDYLNTLTDSSGNTITNNWDENKGILNNTVDANGKTTTYGYDNMDRMINVSKTVSGKNVQNSYSYQNDRISTITQNGFNYNFGYDPLGNNTTVSVGSQNLITNSYENTTGNLLSSTYGNGQIVSNDYDSLDRITTKNYQSNSSAQKINRFSYQYDSSGNIGYETDNVNGVSYRYIYDAANRLVRIKDTNGNIQNYNYDANNNISSTDDIVNGTKYSTSYTYDKDNKLKTTTYTRNNSTTVTNNYDTIGRITNKVIGTGTTSNTTSYNYLPGINGSTTTRIQSINNTINNNNNIINYTYDANGNIKTITRGGQTITYYYDELNELIREDNPFVGTSGNTIVYTYDNAGNLVNKSTYPLTQNTPTGLISSVNYQYGDGNWKDKLTTYNGVSIGYDAIGNPTSYNGWTYSWEEGRQLSSIQGNGYTIAYKYNDNGIRTSKTANGVTTSYHLDGDKVTYESNGTDKIYYTYDSTDNLVSMNLNGVEYYYVRNAQGDIIGLFDKTGTQVVSYTYDTWGKLISTTGTLASTVGVKNPYRYRGYRYDTETQLYYLNSRYYNPEWGRFINADAAVGQIGNIQGHNMFQYCFNNPVNLDDPSGHWPKLSTILTGVAVVAAAVAITAVVVATAGAAAPALAMAGGAILGGSAGGAAGIAMAAGMVAIGAGAAATGVKAIENSVSRSSTQSYTVYALADDSGEVQYVGRTKNFDARMKQHQKPGSRTEGLTPAVRIDNLSYSQARGIEQIGMTYYHTRAFMGENGVNLINGISPKRWGTTPYLAAGRAISGYLYNQVSNEILNWTE